MLPAAMSFSSPLCSHKIVDIESSHARLKTALRSVYILEKLLYDRHLHKNSLHSLNVGVHINRIYYKDNYLLTTCQINHVLHIVK